MAMNWSPSSRHPVLHLGLLSILLVASTSSNAAAGRVIRSPSSSLELPVFREAPSFRNGVDCAEKTPNSSIHIAMTLDINYLRGTMAAIFSMLQHSLCPENLSFHFVAVHFENELASCIRSTFPNLNFSIYHFEPEIVRWKISRSIRQALDQPLNYARIYLAGVLPSHVSRVIYVDSDLIVVDDIHKLWMVDLEGKVIAAPEYCHANFSQYFTKAFWSNPEFLKTFEGRNPCYFNTGVMVMDVDRWRKGGYTQRVEEWMSVQKKQRIYHLGSLPPFLLVLAGNIKPVDLRWNQHGLGGDNFEGKCRNIHPGPVSLLHWSGKGKPWLRLDSRKPCAVDQLWEPYDLYRSSRQMLEG